MFFCKRIYILKVYSIRYTLISNTNVNKISFGQKKKNNTKNTLLLLSRAPTHHSFTFNSRLLYELKHMVHLSTAVYGIFHFPFLFKFIFLFNKKHGLFDFKTS